jgi:hypothetical protein
MRVIEIKGVRQRAAQQGRRRRCICLRIAGDAAGTRRQPETFDSAHHCRGRFRIVAGADHDPCRIENEELGALGDLLRQIFVSQVDSEFGQLAANARHRLSLLWVFD